MTSTFFEMGLVLLICSPLIVFYFENERIKLYKTEEPIFNPSLIEINNDENEHFLDLDPVEFDTSDVDSDIKENTLHLMVTNMKSMVTDIDNVLSYQDVFYQQLVSKMSGSSFINDKEYTPTIAIIDSIKKNNNYLKETTRLFEGALSVTLNGIIIRLEKHTDFWDLELLEGEIEKSIQIPFYKNLGLEIEKQITYMSLLK